MNSFLIGYNIGSIITLTTIVIIFCIRILLDKKEKNDE